MQYTESYGLQASQSTKNQTGKKIPETDAIFDNIRQVKNTASKRRQTLQISIDCKATVKLGEFSRGGKSRGPEAVKALDHDMATKEKMIPFGILNLEDDQLYVFYGNSYKTSDFVCDAIEQWWDSVKVDNRHVDELIVYADNGPENNSHRTQFLLRIVEFAKKTGLRVHLVYYPPYHSKYNPIERGWSYLEKHWNGGLLTSVVSVLQWTKTMVWKCMTPIVKLLDRQYAKGVRLNKAELAEILPHIIRHPELKKWDVTICPDPVSF